MEIHERLLLYTWEGQTEKAELIAYTKTNNKQNYKKCKDLQWTHKHIREDKCKMASETAQ